MGKIDSKKKFSGDNMKLNLVNVGKIKKADIKLDGITVIAGENNTGKSTIGKMLFCVFNTFYKIEMQINEERQKTIARIITNYYHEMTSRLTRSFQPVSFVKYIVENKEMYVGDMNFLMDELKDFYIQVDKHFEKYIDEDKLEKLADKIIFYLGIDDNEIKKVILKKRLDAEFGMKVGHLNNLEEISQVELQVKSNSIQFEIMKNEDIEINQFISLFKDIIYVDDPFVLDNLNQDSFWGINNRFEHRGDLLLKLMSNENTKEFSVVDELVVDKKIAKIFEAMSEVCDGDLISVDGGTSYKYKTDKLNGELEISNLSTGMKSFIILRRLLKNGKIDENGVIILDEPEIHLHPEWQLKFAEIIVLIQKEFGMNILLNTHSPYFLDAIEVFSRKYEIEEKCNYYLTEEIDKRVEVVDVTSDRERIYEKLARPLQDLENMRY